MNLTALLTMALFTWGSNDSATVSSTAFNFTLQRLLNHSIPVISIDSLARNLNSYTLLDAREAEEHSVSSIRGARHIGYQHFDISCISDLDLDTPIVIYCSIGVRSEKIGEKLKTAGFTNVHNLYGGIFEWVNRGNPVYGHDKQTSMIHAYSRLWGIWLRKGDKIY